MNSAAIKIYSKKEIIEGENQLNEEKQKNESPTRGKRIMIID